MKKNQMQITPPVVPPLQVHNVVASLAEHPNTYLMAHLLATGFRGTEYQLLVLLWRLLSLLSTNTDFEAVTEIEGYGNLDDIGLTVKDKDGKIKKIETYQVKYYNHPIEAQYFINSSDQEQDDKKNKKKQSKFEKMHIGKFFAGWLSWKTKYEQVVEERLIKSIVFSNATLDVQLQQCITNGKFHSDFIEHKTKILVNRKNTQIGKVYQNFLVHKDPPPSISQAVSKNVWTELREQQFIDQNGNFTVKYNPAMHEFKLNMSSEALSFNYKKNILEEAYIVKKLAPLYQKYADNQVDFFQVLQDQAWAYLEKKQLHAEIRRLDKQEKVQLFRKFLQSFRFKMDQLPIEQLETAIQQQLATLQKQPSDQLYVCLYYALRAWFRKETSDQKMPVLNAKLMRELIEQAEVRSREVILLQGRTEEALACISYFSAGRCIIPNAVYRLAESLRQPGIVIVTGDKGMGKSGMVKLTLEQLFHSSQYLFFQAERILKDSKLRNDISSVLKYVSGIQVLVIDSAEVLFNSGINILRDFFELIKNLPLTLVLNIAAEIVARQKQNLNYPHQVINVELLQVDDVLHYFPELKPYQTIRPLINLAQKPFYLNTILQILTRLGNKSLDGIKNLSDIELQAKLIKIALKGSNKNLIKRRKLAMIQFVSAITEPRKSSEPKSKLSNILDLKLLQQDGFVVKQNDNYHFSHDLFFEYALMFAWYSDWKHAQKKNKGMKFWENFGKNLASLDRIFIFEKWLALYAQEIINSIIFYWHVIQKLDYPFVVIEAAIKIKNDQLFDFLLEQKAIPVNDSLSPFCKDLTAVSLAIQSDYPQGLRQLLSHDASVYPPLAGELIIDISYNSAYYRHPLESVVEQQDETDESSNEDSSEYEASFYGGSDTDDSCNLILDNYHDDEYQEDQIDIGSFTRYPAKYWSAGFNEEPGYMDDEGEYIENPKYHSPPQNDFLYLHHAASLNRTECLKILLDSSPKECVNLVNTYKETAIHLAALQGANDAVSLLIDENADLNFIDTWGETALHNAAYAEHLETVQLLLEKKAEVNRQNQFGITALHIALMHLNLRMVALLFSYGADISLRAFDDYDDVADENKTVAGLLETSWLPATKAQREEIEDFVIDVIKLLNCGKDDGFVWADKCAKQDEKKRQAQLDEVKDLMTLVAARAQLSESHIGFDYTNEEEELIFAIENGDLTRLENLVSYILADPNNIAKVLEADTIGPKHEILEAWLQNADQEEYDNLKKYCTTSCKDQALIAFFNSDGSSSESEEDDSQLSAESKAEDSETGYDDLQSSAESEEDEYINSSDEAEQLISELSLTEKPEVITNPNRAKCLYQNAKIRLRIFDEPRRVAKPINVLQSYSLFENKSNYLKNKSECYRDIEASSLLDTKIPEGLEFCNIPRDNHCLFHAIGTIVYPNYQRNAENAFIIRREIVAHMREHSNEFAIGYYNDADRQTYLQNNNLYETFDEYLCKIEKTALWGSSLEIKAAQQLYNRPIFVYVPGYTRLYTPDETDKLTGQPIFLYHNGSNHYDLLRVEANCDVQDILNWSIQPTEQSAAY